MNLRPINRELAEECFRNKFCENCKIRTGCPIRKMFYDNDDLDFEIEIQSTECMLRDIFPDQKDDVFDYTQMFRKKRRKEQEQHPWFTYR